MNSTISIALVIAIENAFYLGTKINIFIRLCHGILLIEIAAFSYVQELRCGLEPALTRVKINETSGHINLINASYDLIWLGCFQENTSLHILLTRRQTLPFSSSISVEADQAAEAVSSCSK